MNIERDLPEFNWNDDTLIQRYTDELRKVNTLDMLKAFVQRWHVIWEADHREKPTDIREMDLAIVKGSLTDNDLNCIRLSFQERENDMPGVPCEHALAEKLCPGLEIRMPWSQLTALEIAQRYDCTISMTFHQAFCRGERECF